ncbi:Glu-tRNA(Gln) amidotransferase GatDE subunit E [Candidatus Woesearchaeota archaeon]|nr:MAG: Glu-tRNA(Gln) amidotransferase GatDE subunit E [Candidatus Woesearchaeota archaeon]
MAVDYEELGFKAGLEIHQQLEGKKLFCNCPTKIIDDKKEKPDLVVERQLRAVAGETGEIDVAAVAEAKKSKIFKYWVYKEACCEIELDDEPPHGPNMQALTVALQVAKLLNCKIVDEVIFMRKTVIDGSNTSGFQRTALIGYNGWIDTSKGKVRIDGIFLEEEAAKIVKRTKEYDIYNLSRLGIPLIEIATAADIKDPEHAKEVAHKIGLVLRSVSGIKRGLGTIRQDVNLSIKNGVRTEVKGFQDYRNIPKVIEYEVKRQLKAIKQGKKLKSEVRKAEPDFTTSFLRPMPGGARMYPETDIKHVKPEVGRLEVPMLIEDKIKDLQKLGLGKDLATYAIKLNVYDTLKDFVDRYKNVKPTFIASSMLEMPKALGKKLSRKINVSMKQFDAIFGALDKGKISKDAVESIIIDISNDLFDLSKYELMSDATLKKELEKIVKANKGKPFNVVIGIAMGKLKGKADGKKIAEMLKGMV